MFFFFLPAKQEVVIELMNGVPIWSAAEYAHDFEWTYRKLCIIDAVVGLIDSGKSDEDIFFSDKSLPRYQYSEINKSQFSKLTSINSIKSSHKDFWHNIVSFRRPAAFFRDGESYIPISTTAEMDSLKAKIAIQSPPLISFEGIGEIIHELRYGAEENQRKREKHEIEMKLLNERLKKEMTITAYEEEVRRIEVDIIKSNIRDDHKLLGKIKSSSLSEVRKNEAISAVTAVHNAYDRANQKYGAKVSSPGPRLNIQA